MTTKLTLTNQPGDAPYSSRTFHAYVVEVGELLRYGKPARSRTVEFYDASGEGSRPEREGQFVADYHAETLQGMTSGLGLNLYGGEQVWALDGEALAALLDALA